MENLEHLIQGFQFLFTPKSLLFSLLGVEA
jgi:hypothetical protein